MEQQMKTLNQFKKEAFRDRNLKKAYDQREPEFLLIQHIIENRLKRGLTQAQLAKKLKTKQSAISRFESGNSNPTIDFLYRLARVLDITLKITIS